MDSQCVPCRKTRFCPTIDMYLISGYFEDSGDERQATRLRFRPMSNIFQNIAPYASDTPRIELSRAYGRFIGHHNRTHCFLSEYVSSQNLAIHTIVKKRFDLNPACMRHQ